MEKMRVNVNNRWLISIYDIEKASWAINSTDRVVKIKTDSFELTLSDASKEELKKIGEMFLKASL
jgi:hypothetical protein